MLTLCVINNYTRHERAVTVANNIVTRPFQVQNFKWKLISIWTRKLLTKLELNEIHLYSRNIVLLGTLVQTLVNVFKVRVFWLGVMPFQQHRHFSFFEPISLVTYLHFSPTSSPEADSSHFQSQKYHFRRVRTHDYMCEGMAPWRLS